MRMRMFLHIHEPAPPVSAIASSITYYHSYSPSHLIERLLPDGHVDFIVDLTAGPKHIFDNETLQKKQACKKGWISGARTQLISIDAGGANDSMMIVRLCLGAAFNIFKLPLSEVTDKVVDADLVLGHSFYDLRDALMEADGARAKIKVMECFLLKRYQESAQPPSVLQYAFNQLVSAPHQQAIQQLASKTGYSHKHLITLFRKYAGVTPKELMKVMRFQKVVHELETTNAINWSQVAFDCGYYDQAHFIKEFRTFSGYSPASYLVEKGELPNYIPVLTD